jgi:MerR family mercuric resistance operon transcriptional regulator
MQIGKLARAAGVNIQTVRFYEREKLLPTPPRTASGYRDYCQRDLDRILFIRRNHEIGFTLTEIRQLLDLHGALETMPRPLLRKPAQVNEIIALGRERLGQVKEKICALQTMERQLEYLVNHLEKSVPTTCPVAAQNAKVSSANTSRQRKMRSIGSPVNPDRPRPR